MRCRLLPAMFLRQSMLWTKRFACLTSTSCNMDTTNTSDSAFFHPTIVPGVLARTISDGQKILSSPLAATIVPFLKGSERASSPQLLSRRDAVDRGPRVLRLNQQSLFEADSLRSYTRPVSRAANRSMGNTRRKKKIERMAKPLIVRVWSSKISAA